jgi:Phage integrase family
MEERRLAASTIDRRLSTVCGFYRFAHIDGRISSNPAQYVRRPRVHPSEARGLDRSELGMFLFTAEQYDRDHAALAVLLGLNGLRVSEACATNIEDLGSERGHRTLGILGKGTKPATIPLVPRTARTIDLAVGERFEGPVLRRRDGERLDRRTARRWVRAIGKRAGLGQVHPHMLRAAFIMAALRRSVLMGGGELTDKALERAPRMPAQRRSGGLGARPPRRHRGPDRGDRGGGPRRGDRWLLAAAGGRDRRGRVVGQLRAPHRPHRRGRRELPLLEIRRYTRNRLIAAGRHGLDAVDGPYASFGNPRRLPRGRLGCTLGCVGGGLSTPRPIAVANEVSVHTPDEVARGRRRGRGSAASDQASAAAAEPAGTMIDAATASIFQVTLDHAALIEPYRG